MSPRWFGYLRVERLSAIYLWVLFVAIFGIWKPTEFLTSSTFHTVATEQAVSAIVALAVLIPMVCGQFDLSVGANANLTGVVAGLVQVNLHWNAGLAILFSVVIGVAIGAVNGALVVGLGVNSFIATLGMSSVLSAFLVIVTGSLQPAPATSSFWNSFTQHTVFGLQIIVIYMLVVALLAWWFLEYTPAGRYLYAIGSNREAARLTGVRVDRLTWFSLVLSGTVAGFGGVLFTSLTGPSLTFGSAILLPAFAAAFLGSTQLTPGRFNVWGTLIAIYVLATGVQGLELASGQQWLGDMFDGVALIAAVALAVSRQRKLAGAWSRRRGERRQAVARRRREGASSAAVRQQVAASAQGEGSAANEDG